MAQEIVLGITLKADGSGLTGAIAGVSQEIKAQEPIWKSLATSMGLVNAATALLEAGMNKIREVTDFLRGSVQDAARYQTLGVAMEQVGRNAGYTADQMAGFEAGLRKNGIAMIESRQTLTQMASAHIDLSKAAALSRIAQDAAVIGNMNSSEAFSRMIYGIQSGQVEVLRTIGINVNFEASYQRLARQLGVNAALLTENEKATARSNAVLAAGPAIAGAYEVSMATAGKQLNSMSRYLGDLSVKMGTGFLEAFTQKVFGQADSLNMLGQEMDKLLASGDVERWGHNLAEGLNTAKDGAMSLGKFLWDLRSPIEALGAAYLVFKVASNLGPWIESQRAAKAASAEFYGAVLSGSAVMLGGRTAAEMQARAVMETATAELAAAEAAVAHARATTLANEGVIRLALAENMLVPALQREAAAQVAATAARESHAAALAATTISARASGIAQSALSRTVAALGGPIGVVITLLGMGATAWTMFGDKGKTAIDELDERSKSIEERLARVNKELKYGAGAEGEDRARLDKARQDMAAMRSNFQASDEFLAKNNDYYQKLKKQESDLLETIAKSGKATGQRAVSAPAATAGRNGTFDQLASQYAPKTTLSETLTLLDRSKAEELKIAGDAADQKADIESTYQRTRKGIIERMGGDAHRAIMEGFDQEAASQKAAEQRRLLDVETSHRLGNLSDQEYIDAKLAIENDGFEKSAAILNRKYLAAKDEAEREKILGEQSAVANQRAMAARKANADSAVAAQESAKAEAAAYSAIYDPIRNATDALRKQNDQRGKTTMAIAQERLQQWELAEAMSGSIGAYEGLINLQRQYVDELQRSEAYQSDWRNGITEALNSYLDQVQDVAAQSERAMTSAFKGMEDALVNFVRTGKLDFKSLADSIISDLIRMQVQESITGPLAKTIKSSGGIGGFLDGLFGNSASGGTLDLPGGTAPQALDWSFSANGNVFQSAGLHRFANTVQDSPFMFKFANGGAFGVGAEAGPEAIMPLARGSDGKLGVMASGGGGAPSEIRVEIVNHGTPQQVVSATPSFDGRGMVLAIVTEDIAKNGDVARQMQSTYGLNRAAGAW